MPTEVLKFASPRHLNQLYCAREELLESAADAFGVELTAREDELQISGEDGGGVSAARELFQLLDGARKQGIKLAGNDFENMLEAVARGEGHLFEHVYEAPLVVPLRRASIVPKTLNQKRYLQFIQKHDVVFGVGPAGTGKTYLAVASALHALQHKQVRRVIVTRPAVEAGEALGFLPGDLQEKLHPYLLPIYDAMNDMLGKEETARYMEKGVIEIAPLAYMRGRTLSDAYVLLDEAQNTTQQQMMMFLTRLGENSKMIITGDITQVDLPHARQSGLKHAVTVLQRIKGIKVFTFDSGDVVRHPLVSRIIQAYEGDAEARSPAGS
jgi:phosphate starvation-inducible PhoH-like protein